MRDDDTGPSLSENSNLDDERCRGRSKISLVRSTRALNAQRPNERTPNVTTRSFLSQLIDLRTGVQTFAAGLSSFLLFTASSGAEAAVRTPDAPRLDWQTKLQHFQVDKKAFVGQRFIFECPERGARDTVPAIHGTNVYPSNTPLCPAAVHAGVVGFSGGRVTVQLNPGLESYSGSKKNGVSSSGSSETERSIVFLRDAFAQGLTPIQREYAPELEWTTKFTSTGLANRKLVGQRFVFNCPRAPDKLPGRRIYGTDRYAFNSLVCLTAVHAGKITTEGGYVAVQMIEPEDKLEGSIQNGIESKDGPRGTRQLVYLSLPTDAAATGDDQ